MAKKQSKQSVVAKKPGPIAEVIQVPKGPRTLVKRQVPAIAGSGNIVVVKRGEDLRRNLSSRLELMMNDLPTVELYWDKIMTDPTYNETKEFPDHSKMIQRWELKEGVKLPAQYRSKIRRFETLAEYFQPGYDYEMTVDEVVEILT